MPVLSGSAKWCASRETAKSEPAACALGLNVSMSLVWSSVRWSLSVTGTTEAIYLQMFNTHACTVMSQIVLVLSVQTSVETLT